MNSYIFNKAIFIMSPECFMMKTILEFNLVSSDTFFSSSFTNLRLFSLLPFLFFFIISQDLTANPEMMYYQNWTRHLEMSRIWNRSGISGKFNSHRQTHKSMWEGKNCFWKLYGIILNCCLRIPNKLVGSCMQDTSIRKYSW